MEANPTLQLTFNKYAKAHIPFEVTFLYKLLKWHLIDIQSLENLCKHLTINLVTTCQVAPLEVWVYFN